MDILCSSNCSSYCVDARKLWTILFRKLIRFWLKLYVWCLWFQIVTTCYRLILQQQYNKSKIKFYLFQWHQQDSTTIEKIV